MNGRGRVVALALMLVLAVMGTAAGATSAQNGASPALKDPQGRSVPELTRASRPGYLEDLRGIGVSPLLLRRVDEDYHKVLELLAEYGKRGATVKVVAALVAATVVAVPAACAYRNPTPGRAR